jgi:hypothetical protein
MNTTGIQNTFFPGRKLNRLLVKYFYSTDVFFLGHWKNTSECIRCFVFGKKMLEDMLRQIWRSFAPDLAQQRGSDKLKFISASYHCFQYLSTLVESQLQGVRQKKQ